MNTREIDFWIGAQDPRIKPEYFNQIVATAADIALVISMDGRIETIVVNPLNQSIGRLDHWINRDLSEFLAEDSRARIADLLEEYRQGKAEITPSVEVNHFDNAIWDFPIRYSFHLTGHDQSLLMLGRDLRPIAELQQRLVKAQLALEKDYESRRDFETRYRVLMETSRDALVLVDTSTGRVIDVNAAAASMIGAQADALVGVVFANELKGQKKTELVDKLSEAATSDGEGLLSFTTQRSGKLVNILPKLFRAGGDRLILCRVVTEARVDGLAADLRENLDELFRSGPDAMVFTDETGRIETCNEAFLNLVDAPQPSNVRNRSLAEFLSRGNVDLKVLLDNAGRGSRIRIYSTRLSAQHGSQVAVEISATSLAETASADYAFILRDNSRSEAMRETPATEDAEKMRDVVELVGSSPLKDIVSATTDVIEKLCIETAVELTGNNRVAAAEMLGLSRQSLYVKLRKYGLLDRNG